MIDRAGLADGEDGGKSSGGFVSSENIALPSRVATTVIGGPSSPSPSPYARHSALVERARRWLLGRGACYIVLSEAWVPLTNEQPDALGYGSGGQTTMIECKMSRADFLADRRKPHRRVIKKPNGDLIRPRALGCRRYYMTPPRLVAVKDLPERWGLLEAYPKIVRVIRPSGYFYDDFSRASERNTLAELAMLTRWVVNGGSIFARIERSEVYRESQRGIWCLNDEMAMYGCAFCGSSWDNHHPEAMIPCACQPPCQPLFEGDDKREHYRTMSDGAPPSWTHAINCPIDSYGEPV